MPSEILDKLYSEHAAYTEEEIAEKEKSLGVKLPALLREFYLKYAKLEINTYIDYICELNDVNFTYNWLDAEKEDWEEEMEEPIEEIKKKTQNYLVFWSENQGVWSAAILDEDMVQDNPPVYMNSDESIFEWYVASNNFNSFLLSMIWDNSYYCKGFGLSHSEDENEILKTIKENNIDVSQLTPTYNKHTATCWDEEQKKIYMFINKNGEGVFSEMRTMQVI